MRDENKLLPKNTNLVLACHITGIYDVNRNTILEDDTYELVKDWADSMAKAKIKGIIFHNNFSTNTVESFENGYVSFIKIDYDQKYNPNVFRYFIYRDFLQIQRERIDGIFITDITDVVLVKNPFTDAIFTNNPNSIFCGDEPKILMNDWMMAHSSNLRKNMSDYSAYESSFGESPLLNCGIIGAQAALLFGFLQALCFIHERFNSDNQTAYTGDMGAFNYLVRTQYNSNLIYGQPVNTLFKGYEVDRTDCWFRHK